MAHTKSAARKLASTAELTLLEFSFPPALKDITPGRLKQKITRARTLRDKYTDLAQQQRGEARGKRKAKGTQPAQGNANTVAKHEMFDEALTRFEAQLEKLEAKAAKELARKEATATKRAQKTARKTGVVAKRAAGKSRATARKAVSRSARGARKDAAVARSGSVTHQGHVSSRGRRRQAKRDSR